MTDLQNRFHTLQEQIRSNQAQEALKQVDVESSAMLRQSQANLNDRQRAFIDDQVRKLYAEIDKINADTSLSQAKRGEAVSATFRNYTTAITDGLKDLSSVRKNRMDVAGSIIKLMSV